jgi:hypothetical protein
MVEKLHSQLAVGADASQKANHYQEVIQDLKAVLQGKWQVKSSRDVASARVMTVCTCHSVLLFKSSAQPVFHSCLLPWHCD